MQIFLRARLLLALVLSPSLCMFLTRSMIELALHIVQDNVADDNSSEIYTRHIIAILLDGERQR